VVLSSTASTVCVTLEPKVSSEKDWNEQAIEMIREQGKNAPVRLWQEKVHLSFCNERVQETLSGVNKCIGGSSVLELV
jgi:hypothetical protein